MFSTLPDAAGDPILGLTRIFAADPHPDKVDLGIGIYKDDHGRAPVLSVVKAAEADLAARQESKRYLSSTGNPAFCAAAQRLIFNHETSIVDRAATVQAPGGTGALRLALEFVERFRPTARLFLPTPTWANHPALAMATRRQVVHYPYYDVPTGALTFDDMLAVIGLARADDVVLLHGCCHNPSGADLDADQWTRLSEALAKTGALPLLDLAYLGFANGLAEDTEGLTTLARALPELLVATSFSKNFALYRERVGALTVLGESSASSMRVHAHMLNCARTLWSMPPDHGAAVVAAILDDTRAAAAWRIELATMRNRINGVRTVLGARLSSMLPSAHDLAGQRGMFALFDLTPAMVDSLRTTHHFHMTRTGRANLAGLTDDTAVRFADAVLAVTGHATMTSGRPGIAVT